MVAQPASSPEPKDIWILCVGSRGDLQPFCALGRALVKRGHRVTCATNAGAEGFVAASGMAFFKICVDLSANDLQKLGSLFGAFLASRAVGYVLAFCLEWLICPDWNEMSWLTRCVWYLLECMLVCAVTAAFGSTRLYLLTGLPCPRFLFHHSVFCEVIARRIAEWIARWAGSVAGHGLGVAVGCAVYPSCLLKVLFLGLEASFSDELIGLLDLLVALSCPVSLLIEQLKGKPPDLIICQTNCLELGLVLKHKCRIPLLKANLIAASLGTTPPPESHYWLAVARERILLGPISGIYPIRDMGCSACTKLVTEDLMCGLPSFLSRSRCGLFSKESLRRNVLTGTWSLDAKEEQEVFSEMFGSSEARTRCEEFIGQGKPPVYIGWGSMAAKQGPAHMCCLAVGALQRAGRRGIILGGWAKLSSAMLEGSSADLRAFAAANVLFLQAAPHGWLLPRCSCAVIHGGIGTLSACWRAGVPTVVCPFVADQSFNNSLNEALGCGPKGPNINKCGPADLAVLIIRASSPHFKANVSRLSYLMQQDEGLPRAVEHIEEFMRAQ